MNYLSIRLGLVVLCLIIILPVIGQVNTSEIGNYKNTSGEYGFKSSYANGYVTLRDGTQIDGKISIFGSSYERIYGVKIKTYAGEKYNFQARSLKEYGLSNSSVNDTPELFSWGEAAVKLKGLKVGYTDFGYVVLKDGTVKEGELKLKEYKGRIQSLEVKDANKEKFKYEAAEVSNYGVRVYEDEKFNSLWSLIRWKVTAFQSDLASTKSELLPGYVILTNGQKQEGYIQLLKKETMITQIHLRSSKDAKPTKIKYGDIQEYGVSLTQASYYKLLEKQHPLESYPPHMKFHPGTLQLVDGTEIEAQMAFATNNIYGDLFYINPENGNLVGVKSVNIDEATQDIPQEDVDAYEQFVYDVTHVKGLLIQNPPKYDYKMINGGTAGIYETRPQFGFVKLKSGQVMVGTLYLKKNGSPMSMIRAFISENGEKPVKYAYKDMESYGLIAHEATTAFNERLIDGSRNGFVVLMEGKQKVEGLLSIEAEESDNVKPMKIFKFRDGKSYKESEVDYYGLVDVPVSDLTSDGTVYYEDEKRNFHPGSYSNGGSSKSGYIAWAKPPKKGAYDAFYFADAKDGVANVYYVSKGASDVIQTIEEEFEAYDPADDSFLLSKTIETDIESNGYVITTDGERIDGQIEMSFPPKLWFATDVSLTQEDGTVTDYGVAGGIQSLVTTLDGQEKEFVYFDGAYIEVLDHQGDWVHFRNPHPTTPTGLSNWINAFSGAAMNASQEYVDEKVAEYAAVQAIKGNDKAAETAANFLDRERTDYTSYDQFTLYAKEHIIMDLKNNRHAMYIPSKNYQFVEGELMGSIEYLNMEPEAQKGLRKMNNPSETLKYLDTTF